MKRWEESELSGLNEKAPSSALSLSPKKRLAPLNEGGPVQLLKLQVTSNTGITCYYRVTLKVLLGCAAACRERFFGKYFMSIGPCFGSRYIGRLAGS